MKFDVPASTNPIDQLKVIGQPVSRIDGPRKTTGTATYAYEWHDAEGQWFRSYGNENWEFAASGHMHLRYASINDLAIAESDRRYLGPRPADERGPGHDIELG